LVLLKKKYNKPQINYNDMKYIYLIFICFVSFLVIGCSPMDDTYKDFDKDGPILYLTKIKTDDVLVQGGWYRTQLTISPIKDMRANKVFITWNNGRDSLRTDLSSAGNTVIMIDNLREGTFIFTCKLEDSDGNTSLNTDITAFTYGDEYQSFLNNRAIISKSVSNSNLTLSFSDLSDSTAVASAFMWNNGTDNITETFYYDKSNKIILNNVKSTTFKMKTLYIPELHSLDNVWSDEQEFSVK